MRYGVIRYPLYYVVVDHATRNNEIVFETRDRDRAHREAAKRNKAIETERAK